jgi:chromosome segregation ATPase
VSSKQPPTLKQWLKIGSIAFGVSCVCTLPFTLNLGQSALIGLATMPGLAAGTMLRSRPHRQGKRQRARGKLRLQELQHQGAILNEQLQFRHKDRQEVELKVSQLHDLAASLTDRIDRDNDRHQQLEQQLATLTLYCQTQENLAANLDRKIQEQQACLLEVDTNLNSLKLELAQVQSAQVQANSANFDEASALKQQKIETIAIQHQINLCLATKQELELQIQQIQDRKIVETKEFDESIALKHSLLHELDLAISDRQKSQAEIVTEVDRLNRIIAETTPELAIQEQKLADTRSQLSTTELALQARQVELDELAAMILATQIPEQQDYSNDHQQDPLSDRLLQRELKIAQLELSSRQAELDNLEFKLQKKLESISELDLTDSFQAFEPQPPIVDRDFDEIICLDEWYDKFIDNPHLTVLKHIEKHGTITESEASKKLGNARSVRQFANKLEEYAQDLPFSIRVESSPKGNRYLKEDRN